MAYPSRPPMIPLPTMVATPFPIAPNILNAVRIPMTQALPLPSLPPPMHINPPLPPKPPMTHINKPPTFSQRNESSGPPITLFVGNITERAPDIMMRHILNACGPVVSWKRVQGASGKLQGFGFCEFANAEAALRAIRIMNEYEIAGKKLVVKADSKTTQTLNEYKEKRKKQSRGGEDASAGSSSPLQDEKPEVHEEHEDDYLDDEARAEDRDCEHKIQSILMEHRKDIVNYVAPPKDEQSKKAVKVPEKVVVTTIDISTLPSNVVNVDDIGDVEEGKKELISREISQFRETMKKQEEEKERDRRVRERERELRDNHRDKDRERERERERERWEKEDRKRRRSPSESKSRRSTKSRSPERITKSSRTRKDKGRSMTKSPSKSEMDTYKQKELDHEEKERKEQERKIRKKEIQYQERLSNWETRESKKLKERLKEKDRERDRDSHREREAQKLRQFLEDYDDERDDPVHYKGHSFERKHASREEEKELDSRDRAKEKEELQELKKKIMNEGHKDPDAVFEQARIERDNLYQLKPLKSFAKPPKPVPPPKLVEIIYETNGVEESQDSADARLPEAQSPESDGCSVGEANPSPVMNSPPPEEVSNTSFVDEVPVQNEKPTEDISAQPKKRKLDVKEVFNQDDDEDIPAKKKKLPLPGKDKSSKEKGGGEEKRKHIKSLIDKIPTTKEELFAFPIDSSLVDNVLMEKRIKPWINKKIIEYIGEPEETLVEFICSKVLVGSEPQSLLNDVQMVLDDEAEVFVVKMWRLLIYEIEAKRLGLGKA